MSTTLDGTEISQTCVCGRSFSQGGLKNHSRSCSKSKKCLASAFAKAKEIWNPKKQRHLQDTSHDDSQLATPDVVTDNEAINRLADTSDADETIPPPTPCPVEHLSIAERRPRRLNRQLQKRFRDIVPQLLPLLPLVSENSPAAMSPPHLLAINSTPISPEYSPINSLGSHVRQLFQTPRNVFGLFRRYRSENPPYHDPEEYVDLQNLSDELPDTPRQLNFYPYPNESSFRLGEWYWNSGMQKSRESFNDLLSIVGDQHFRPEDVQHTSWRKIDAQLASNSFAEEEEEEGVWVDEGAGWSKIPIAISVPFHKRHKNPGPKTYVIGDLYHRNLVSIICEKLTGLNDHWHLHYEPFELFWKPTDSSEDIAIHGELYTSPAFLDAHREVQELPAEPGCNLPRVVIAMMFSSDATQLTSFGTAKLWPSYIYFGNELKYRRCKPTCHSCSHIAYFQTLPNAFKDFATQNTGTRRPTGAFMTHCRREVLHAQWAILLDDEFREAYKHGIVIKCCDRIMRQFYPRILAYTADYPEKVLLASIRDKGYCPCPRCLIPRSHFHNLGMVQDMKQRKTLARFDDENRRRKVDIAREIIYEKNYAVNSPAVEVILKEQSLVLTLNAFSQRLAPLGFNLFIMLLVDLMHEFELGVWRALFIHLLHMLNAVDKTLVDELDHRQVPSFGRDTIRRFAKNMSELKRLTAHNFEDLLQCAIPVFDGLFPEPHNSAILHLLFVCAQWHGLAKLRLHTDQTLALLDDATVEIGNKFHSFTKKDVSSLKKASGSQVSNVGAHSLAPDKAHQKRDNILPKSFNLDIYKYHALGDYANTIRRCGTTDSYTSEPQTRAPQLTQIERRETCLCRIRAKLSTDHRIENEAVPTSPQEHHHIGVTENHYDHIGTFLRDNAGDPAIKNFLPKLKQHLLARILSLLRSEDPQCHDGVLQDQNNCDPNSVIVKHDRLYRHKLICINYTTYDIRRSQDTVNWSTSHCNIMTLTEPGDNNDSTVGHPFKYARVLGVYHVNTVYIGPGSTDYQPRQIEFLWVRWYEKTGTIRTRWEAKKLDRIRFLPVADDDTFGFVDPLDALRSCHIIPAFARGLCHVDSRGLSSCARDSLDWAEYYVNCFVDQDMTDHSLDVVEATPPEEESTHDSNSVMLLAPRTGRPDSGPTDHDVIESSDSQESSSDSGEEWQDDEEEEGGEESDWSDEEFLSMHETYGI
ncbi:hypothetical protein PILCRDRAFT_11038 [Piloderma croceum F 1598]|uniref:Uncharacterized protein n=1 Tax=Piloderma croceum (strain F 1598) TaxID=765440 RepID=A0A0C3BMP7_PILCF|nr:hypothetical protein PILCRDRAFT_11038 [Piloderma croceum F 1598]